MLVAFQHQLISDWRREITMNNELFIELSIQLASLLYQRHERQGVQGNLHTRQISVHSQNYHVYWNFHIDRQPRAYMAPEQFGMINRKTDVRSDLYSVGIILFELLFSTLPFDLDRYEDWAHVHLYASPKQLVSETSQPIYRIIDKLLSKSPDERYQSSYGLLYDLTKLKTLMEHKQYDQMNEFTLGEADIKQQLHIYDHFVPRIHMIDELQTKLDLVDKFKRSHIVLLHGDSGLGKTVLLGQYQQRLQQTSSPTSLYINVVSDASEPYFLVKQLIPFLLEQVLQCENKLIEAYISECEQHLGPMLPSFLQLFPQAGCLWPHIELGSGSPLEYETNEEFLLSTGLKILLQIIQPDTLLIDTSDSIDPASLNLVSAVLVSKGSPPVYIVIAALSGVATSYRAALESGRDSAEQQAVTVHLLELSPFSYEELTLFMGHALSEHTTRIKRLCWAIYYWTRGIPHKIIELLEQWRSSGILFYDDTEHRWMWHHQHVSNMFEAEHRLSVPIDHFLQLQPETVQLLSYASVIGMQFNRSELMRIRAMDSEELQRLLAVAITNGVIAMIDEQKDPELEMGEVQYLFLLRELHEQFYLKLSSVERAKIHLQLGHVNAEYHAELARAHWNQALPVMGEAMRQHVIQLNYDQAMDAFNKNKFRKAAEDFELALKASAPQWLTDEASDPEEPDERQLHMLLMLSISLSYSQQTDRAKTYFNQVEQYAHKLKGRDYLYVCLSKMEFYAFTDNQTTLSIGQESLARFGLELGTQINPGIALVEVLRTLRAVRAAAKHPERLVFSEEPSYLAQCELMESLVFPYMIEDPTAYSIHFSRFIRNGMKQGINRSFLCSFASFEVILQRGLPDLYKLWPKDMLNHLHQIAQDASAHTSILTQFSLAMLHQLENPLEAESKVLKVIELAGEQGHHNLLNLASVTLMVISQGYLPHLEQFFEKVNRVGKYQLISSTTHYMDLTQNYYDAWKDPDAQRTFIQLHESGEAETIDNFIAIQRAEQAYLAKRFDIGMKWIEVARTNELSVDWIRNRRMRMYEALLAAELYRNSPHSMRDYYKRIVVRRAKRMQRWSGAYGADSAAHYVIRAEACLLDNKYYEALLYYERAVKQAKQEGNELLEAIACERLAYTYQEQEQTTGFHISLLDAIRAYKAWGATVKVNSLLASYPSLAQRSKIKAELAVDDHVLDAGQEYGQVDHQPDRNDRKSNLSRRAQPIRQEAEVTPMTELSWTSLDSNVLNKNMTEGLGELTRSIKLHTGAEQVVLFQLSAASLNVLAHSELQGEQDAQQDLVNRALIQYVGRIQQTIIVDHAMDSMYARHSYIRKNRVKSLLCMPILLPDRQRAILYLENRTLSHVFSQKSVDTIEMLNTRFAYIHLLQHPIPGESQAETNRNESSQLTSNNHSLQMEKLTARELEILQLIADGYSNKEIGAQLFVSEATVKSHVYKIYQKMSVKRRAQAVSVARELNLIK